MRNAELLPGHQTYFRFLKLAQSINSIDTGAVLTANETRLLQEVTLRYFDGQAFTVQQALALKDLGSPATLHKRIQRLRNGGFLGVELKDADHRTKYLIATPLAMQYFESLGLAMQKAIQG